MEDEQAQDVSRRAIIKRAGVGAAVVWVAPVIVTMAKPAAAASNFPGTENCQTRFVCGDVANCGPDGSCLCTLTTEGLLFCSNDFSCADVPTCTTSTDCPAGWQCQAAGTGCCGVGYCLPPCGVGAAGAGAGPKNAG